MPLTKHFYDYWKSFSFVGLAVAMLFFSASVTPSLLPRPYYVQGILSALAIATGYAVGVGCVWLYQFLGFPNPNDRIQSLSKKITAVSVTLIFVFFVRQMAYWQNSIRLLMEMPTLESAYPYRTAGIAVLGGATLIAFARLLILVASLLSQWLNRALPRRVSVVISAAAVLFAIVFIGNGIVARRLLDAADAFFLQADRLIDEGAEQPSAEMAAGSDQSLVPWESIGREGKNFIASGPTQAQISEFLGRDAKRPLRVYVGMRSQESARLRAELALGELQRIGAFERSILIVATPTGTGWLDPGAVDSVEYLHAGDTAIVSTQYSYLPSWITILVDPRRSIESAYELFDVVYNHWKTLPKDRRPRLYLHGLSLGSLGSEVSADLYTTFEDPIQGALWSGPPFASSQWRQITSHRNAHSPPWLPTYRDGRLIRFTAQKNALDLRRAADPSPPHPTLSPADLASRGGGEGTTEPAAHFSTRWGPIRNVYIQYASDPMVFFSPSLVYQKPDWLAEPRGPDVTPHLTWFPIITFLQVALDLPMATSIPVGYGHNYAASSYIDAWVEVTQPANWSRRDSERLKQRLEESSRTDSATERGEAGR